LRDIVLVLVVLACTAFAVARPSFGILAFICVSVLNPNSWTWGFARGFPSAQLIILGTMVGFLFGSEPKRVPLRRESVLLLMTWAAFTLSTMFADSPESAVDKLVLVSKVLLTVFLTMAIIHTEERLRWLFRVIVLSLGVHGLNAGLFFVMTGGHYMVWGPERSFLYANNMIGLALAMNVPLLVLLSGLESNRWLRWLMRAMAVFSYPAVIGTYSRGAWLGLAAATVMLVARSRHRVLVAVVIVVVAIVSLPFLPERATDRYSDLVNYEEEASAQSRFWNWRFARRVTMANPILGAGFDYYTLAAYYKYYPEFQEAWPGKVWSCHSIWFTMMSEHGLLGFFLWTGMLLSAFVSLHKMRSLCRPRANERWVCIYADMIQISLVVFMVSGTFLDAAYFDVLYYLIAIVVIMKEVVGHPDLEQPEVAAAPTSA
jgi:probable O-glycosylation ligase (exosortase A-associated)